VDILEGHLAGAVMAARQNGELVRDAELPEFSDEIFGKIDGKGEVVAGIDEERPPAAHAIEKQARADRRPQRAQQIEIDVTVESLAHVPRRQAPPDYVRQVGGE